MSGTGNPSTWNNAADGWHAALARIIDDLGSERLPETLIAGLAEVLPFDMAAIFIYRRRSRPIHLYDNFTPVEAKQGITAYIEGTYVLNPFYQAYLGGLMEGVYLMRDLASDLAADLAPGSAQRRYRAHRVSPSASEEIGYLTDHWPRAMQEMDLAIFLDSDVLVEITLSRAESDHGFGAADVDRVSTVFPAVAAVVRKQLAEFSVGGARHTPPDSRIDDAFAAFGKAALTEREGDVVRLVLRGYSSEAICQHLNISLGTVKTHRKNAYARLRISSQSELLSLFLRSLKMS